MEQSLLSVAEARERLLQKLVRVDIIQKPLLEAENMFLAEDIRAPQAYPRFDNSSMDGFAVRAQDIATATITEPSKLEIIEMIQAGVMPKKSVGVKQAARIMTGAAMPEGADCVVPIEQTNLNWRQSEVAENAKEVEIYEPVKNGDYVRRSGEDYHTDQIVLKKRRLRAQDIGFLAMLGVAQVRVFRKPRVGLLSSGDELVAPGNSLQPGQIYESNSYTLRILAQKYHATVYWLGIVRDEEAAVRKAFDQALAANVDLIVSTAGVSVGAFDFVREVLEKSGSLEFWRVNMRPGKPVAFGSYHSIPFIGLPGNPVSSFVGFEVFARPALLYLSGEEARERASVLVTLEDDIESDGRESYLRAVVTNHGLQKTARLTGHQGSGNLHSLVEANALLIIPSGVKSLRSGSNVEAWLID